MSTTIRGLIGTSVAALLALAFVPATASAQQQQQEQDQCTVTVHEESGQTAQQDRQEQEGQQAERQGQADVPTVESGKAAVTLQVQVSEGLRQITEFAAAEGSGLRLASEDDLSTTDMTRTGDQEQSQPQPISMDEGSRTATVWVNTEEASPGTYQVSFRGGETQCDTQLRVKDGDSGR